VAGPCSRYDRSRLSSLSYLFFSCREWGGTSKDLEGAHLSEFMDVFFAGLLTSQGGGGTSKYLEWAHFLEVSFSLANVDSVQCSSCNKMVELAELMLILKKCKKSALSELCMLRSLVSFE
jgi:hypothetical protein